jgi:hypothetical protein
MKHYDQDQLEAWISLRHSEEQRQIVCGNNIKLIDKQIRIIKRRQQVRLSGRKYRKRRNIK